MAKPRVNGAVARHFAIVYSFRLDADFHALTSAEVDGVIAAADSSGYRQPRHANGSRARYFHAYLIRAAARPW